MAYLNVSAMKGVVRFGKTGKLSPCYVNTYLILHKVCKDSYELKIPRELPSVHPIFHISMLKKCIGYPDVILSI